MDARPGTRHPGGRSAGVRHRGHQRWSAVDCPGAPRRREEFGHRTRGRKMGDRGISGYQVYFDGPAADGVAQAFLPVFPKLDFIQRSALSEVDESTDVTLRGRAIPSGPRHTLRCVQCKIRRKRLEYFVRCRRRGKMKKCPRPSISLVSPHIERSANG
ncbi:hypothetical protein SBA4_5480005 [Candidatus Sulfopaludibacter sp. SbA4]|nr:hypothetical protein SBA4_5480005 [Candidatus Sulfopaludibacter sp. SbA4]